MSRRLTDREAIRRALSIAIDSENALIDGYSKFADQESQPGVIEARKMIAACQRVLDRYYGGHRAGALIDNGKPVSIFDILRGLHSHDP